MLRTTSQSAQPASQPNNGWKNDNREREREKKRSRGVDDVVHFFSFVSGLILLMIINVHILHYTPRHNHPSCTFCVKNTKMFSRKTTKNKDTHKIRNEKTTQTNLH